MSSSLRCSVYTYLLKSSLDDLIQIFVRNVWKEISDGISSICVDRYLGGLGCCLRMILYPAHGINRHSFTCAREVEA
jgi:hypothetical protein